MKYNSLCLFTLSIVSFFSVVNNVTNSTLSYLKKLLHAFSGLIKRRHQTNEICSLAYTIHDLARNFSLLQSFDVILSRNPNLIVTTKLGIV